MNQYNTKCGAFAKNILPVMNWKIMGLRSAGDKKTTNIFSLSFEVCPRQSSNLQPFAPQANALSN